MKRSQLKANPEKVRAWQQRSRDKARDRTRQAVSSGVRRSQKRKASIPRTVRRRVYARSHGVCIRPGCEAKCVQIHHVLDQEHFPQLALTEDNLVGVCARCNQRHHFEPGGRFPLAALPNCALRLAEAVDQLPYLERFYPTGGPS